MPSAPYHAWQLHLSFQHHITGTMTQELVKYQDSATLWYAHKPEEGPEGGKIHSHSIMIFEIQTSTNSGGAKTKYNLTETICHHCPSIKQYLLEFPSKYNMVLQPLKSDEMIAEYLQKESSLQYFRLPKDLCEIKPYFADMQSEKPKNPEYEQWEHLYLDENRDVPASNETVWNFFTDHMFVQNDMKILSDPKRFRERVFALVAFINKEIPQIPQYLLTDPSPKRIRLIGGSAPASACDSSDNPRICPRCVDKDRDVPNFLAYRQQYCSECKNY